jgi:ParB family chromosome partitioning protein
MRIDGIRQSPFQPRGRPSQEAVAAVGKAIERAGGIEALAGAEGHTTFQALSAEAKRLAELAYSVSRDGVRDPVEVRTAEDGAIEALSGHRRLAAARLVGFAEVPVLHRGEMSALQAAATVLSGNLHREDFTPWQEAVLVTEVIAQRRGDGLPADVRTVGAIMGYSHGRVSTLQTIRRVLSPALLARLGDLAVVEEALARYANYSRLEEVARMADDARREAALRRLLGFADPKTGAPVEAPPARTFEHRPKRRGGFTLEVHQAIEEFSPSDAATLRDLLATQVARLDARLRTLGKS